jgi:transposase InsO family protein
MPWKQTNAMEERIRFVVRAEQQKESVTKLCDTFGIHRTTGWRWLKRLQEVGQIEDLREHSRRPHRSPQQTSALVEEKVLELRTKYGWGALKLQVLLAREQCHLSVATINRILKRHGVVAIEAARRPACKRFERSEPNQLWQMDFKGIKDHIAARHGLVYPLSILDDHSRFLVGLFPLQEPSGTATLQCLERVFESYGMPEAMLMDHGTPWWSYANGHGLTHLSIALMKQGVRLYFSGIGHPQTQGKVERLHRTMEQTLEQQSCRFRNWSAWAANFRQEYNHVRPHQALDMAVPADKYRPSARLFRRNPPQWDYEDGLVVKRLDCKGCAAYRSRRYFICEALAGEDVVIEPFRDRVLVRYRNTYVREIDVRTGSTRSLVIAH